MSEEYQQIEGIPQIQAFPEFAISLEEATTRIELLRKFVKDHMQSGEDYGVIPGTSTKPTLFKPGAEKLNAMFGLAPVVEVITRETDWDKGFVAYEIKVTLLNKRTSNIEAEGVGSCNSKERRYRNQDAANIANTILKMAKKRALIDATLSATRASGVFTQDLEDIEQDEPPPQKRPTQALQRMQQAARNTQPQAQRQTPPQAQTPPQRPPTPEHIVKLWDAMKAGGTPYNRETASTWTQVVNQYLNETGDSPKVERIDLLAPEIADDVRQAIEEKLCFFPSPADPTEAVAA